MIEDVIERVREVFRWSLTCRDRITIQERLGARLVVVGKYDHRAVEIDGVGPFRRRSGQWRIRPAGKHGCEAIDRGAVKGRDQRAVRIQLRRSIRMQLHQSD